MRSPRSFSIVCRRRNGELAVRERPMATPRTGPTTWPFVRGVLGVVESLKLGSRALRWSAELFEKDLEDEEGDTPPPTTGVAAALALSIAALATQDGDSAPGGDALDGDGGKRGGLLRFLPILFAIGLFVLLPQVAAEIITRMFHLDLPITSPGYQAITGASKLVIVVGYLLLIRRIAEVRRVFQYHGAEHKAISTYEAKQELVVENARKMTTMHPRCGTTFLVMVALVSIFVFSALGAVLPQPHAGRLVTSIAFFFLKLPCLPIVASVTYEIQRLFARFCTTGPLRALLWPGFLVQKITTAEPDDSQLEIALASLRATLWREEAAGDPEASDKTFADYAELLAEARG